jgi:excisionase family DNA binding protein
MSENHGKGAGCRAPTVKHSGAAVIGRPIAHIDRAMTAEQLAGVLTVSKITIFKQAKAGRIPSFPIGTCVRFDPRAVANWAAHSVECRRQTTEVISVWLKATSR